MPQRERVFALQFASRRQRGKTIVFVSHDMGAVRQICQRAILIHEGSLLADGAPDEVAARYTELLHQPVAAV